MLKIKAKNIDGFIAKLRKHQLIVEGHVTETKRRLVRDIFTDLVQGSPQWSGNLASNWYIEFHGNTGRYKKIRDYKVRDWRRDDPYYAGADPAVTKTLNRELPKIADIRWNSKIQIVNYAPYAASVEMGVGPEGRKIRDVNYKYGQIAMAGYVVAKYSQLRTLKRRV